MGFWKRLFGRPQQQKATIMVSPGSPVRDPRLYEPLAREGYIKNAIAHKSIQMVARSVADIPIELYREQRGQEPEILQEHPILDTIKRPNPSQSKSEFIEAMVSYFLISGNVFTRYVPTSLTNGARFELYNYRPDCWEIEVDQLGLPTRYIYDPPNQKAIVFPVDPVRRTSEILHIKTFNPLSKIFGMSPLEAASFSVDQHNQAGMWNLQLIMNHARPSGVFQVKHDAQLQENQVTDLRDQIQQKYQGPYNAGMPLILPGEMEFKELGFSPKEMDFLASKSVTAKDIALVFGVPAQMVGITEGQTFSNYKEARLSFYQETVLPITRMFVECLNYWLVSRFNGDSQRMFLDIDEDRIDALSVLRSEKWDRVMNAEFLTTNEKREELGFGRYESSDDKDPADSILINSGKVPIEYMSDDLLLDDANEVVRVETEPVRQLPPPQLENEEELEEDEDENGELSEKPSIQVKNVNLRGRAARARLWRAQDEKRQRYEKGFARGIRKAFKSEKDALLELMETYEENGVPQDFKSIEVAVRTIIEEQQQVMREAFASSYNKIIQAFGKEQQRALKSFDVELCTKDDLDLDSYAREFIANHVGEKISGISKRSQKRVLQKLRDKFFEYEASGESIPQMAKEITAIYGAFGRKRAVTIARTETHNTALNAQLAAVRSTGVRTLKEWVPTLDSRTRDSHENMVNHKKIPEDDQFEVQGKEGLVLMDGPGDLSAPAGEVVNCRCVLAFEVVQEQ